MALHAHDIGEALSGLAGALVESGPVGVFALSLFSNAIPFVSVPYLVYIALYSMAVSGGGELAAIVLASAAGAMLGKLIVYFVGRGIGSAASGRAFVRNWQALAGRHRVAAFVAIFLVSVTPFPDDVVLLPMGLAGYSVALYTLAVGLGKLINTALAVFFGRLLAALLIERFGLPLWLSALVLLAATVLLIYLVGQVDWVRAAEIYTARGPKEALAFVGQSLWEAVVRPLASLAKKASSLIGRLRKSLLG